MSNELISVIIPVFNVESYLTRCLESVIGQTLTDLEIILVDDGSTDQSGEICDSYAKKDSRIQVIHKKNGGLSSARNAALDRCSGAYIGFLDSDDYIEPEYYEKLLRAITESDSDIAVAGFARDNGLRIAKTKMSSRLLNNNHAVYEDYLSSVGINHMVVNKLYRASLLSDLRFPEDIKRNEDVWFTTSILTKVSKAVFVPDCYYTIFIRENSLVRSQFSEKDLFLLKVTEFRQNLIKERYADLYHYVAYEMVEQIISIQKKILMQHGLHRNKSDYKDLSSRLEDELEKLPQEYRSGTRYEAVVSRTRREAWFIIKNEWIGCLRDAKKRTKRILIWIKSKRTEEQIKR